jgi:hypothetical protein
MSIIVHDNQIYTISGSSGSKEAEEIQDNSKVIWIIIMQATLIKKKIKFSLDMRKFRMEQLQSHKLLTASSYMGKPFLIYDLYMRKF